MDHPADPHTAAPADHSSTEPKRSRSTCAIVLGVVLASAVLVAGALALLFRPDLMASVHPIRGMAYYNRGLAFGELGNLARAIDDFTQAIALQPDFPGAYSQR